MMKGLVNGNKAGKKAGKGSKGKGKGKNKPQPQPEPAKPEDAN